MEHNRKLYARNYYPWLVVICCCGMLTASFGVPVYCAGIFYVPIAKTLGAKLGEVALLLTIMNITHGLLSPVVIKLCRKTDMRIMSGISMIGISLGFFVLSRVTAVWELYIGAFFIGVFCAFSGLAVVPVIIGNWFHKKNGLAIGITHCVSGLAGAVMAPALKRIIDVSGWRNAYVCVAVLSFIVLVPAVVFIRFRPEEKELLPYGYSGDPVSYDIAEKDGMHNQPASTFTIGKLLTVCLIAFLATFGPGFGVHMSGFTESIGIASSVREILYSVGLIGGTVSKLFTGVSCDRIGAGKTCIRIMALTVIGLCMCMVLPARLIPLFVLAALLIGIGTSMSGVGVVAITKHVFGPREFGRAFAWVSIAAAVGSSSSGIVGFMVDRFSSYIPAVILCAAFGVVAAVLIYVICREPATS